MDKKLMIGNAALARGAYEAGVVFATGYPGTPSTEICEYLSCYKEVKTEWSANEKTAAEAALGCSIAGGRSLVTMKHVGFNVAADLFFSASYTGVGAGFVAVVADDPGMNSSQNEQDTRLLAAAAHLPVLEPYDSDSARVMIKTAFDISEEFDTPVIVRITTRLAHTKSTVSEEPRVNRDIIPFKHNVPKYVMAPFFARAKRYTVLQRDENIRKKFGLSEFAVCEMADSKIGIVTSGVCYEIVKEAVPTVSILRLSGVTPVPIEAVRKFASSVDELFVVEEQEPFLQEKLAAHGIILKGKEYIKRFGELSKNDVALITKKQPSVPKPIENLPARPPVLCSGCPHRGTFSVLKKLKLNVMGDIGCYTLGAFPPLSSLDTCICMGSSIGLLHGALQVDDKKNWVAVIGDSTFFHTGINNLISLAYNKVCGVVIILDNSSTAMTGHQPHPGIGLAINNSVLHKIDIEPLVKAIGIDDVITVNAFSPNEIETVILKSLQTDNPSVIIAKGDCALLKGAPKKPPVTIKNCRSCKSCLKIGCPSLLFKEGIATVDINSCTGCGICISSCSFGCIDDGVVL